MPLVAPKLRLGSSGSGTSLVLLGEDPSLTPLWHCCGLADMHETPGRAPTHVALAAGSPAPARPGCSDSSEANGRPAPRGPCSAP